LAAAASVLFLAAGLIRFFPSRNEATGLMDELIASHVRSQMLAAHLVDVKSSDQHTVKPWFEGKLDFSPEVPDLSGAGFTLVGGRLDYLNHRPVAVLVYQRRKHVISLFVWPSGPGKVTAPTAFNRQGYHILSSTLAGMSCSAVSDLNETELREFVSLINSRGTDWLD
jgi:anti-sigma factor RsiW